MLDCSRAGHRKLSEEVSNELTALGQRLGVTFSVGGGQIGMTDLTIKIKATTNDTRQAEQQARTKLDTYGSYYGLSGQDYGAQITHQGRRFKLVGVQPSRPKYPLDVECMGTGKVFKFTSGPAVIAQIKQQRGTQQPAAAVPPMQLPQGFIPPAFTPPPGMPQF